MNYSRRARKAYAQALSSLYGDVSPPAHALGEGMGRKSPKMPSRESESDAQVRLVLWIEDTFPWLKFYSVPNGANVSASNRARLVREGLSPGTPDLCIPLMRKGHGALYIELKRDEQAVLRQNQVEWLDYLNAQGYYAIRCDGYVEAKECITWYVSDVG